MTNITPTPNGHISQYPYSPVTFAIREISKRGYIIPKIDIFYPNQQWHISLTAVDPRVNTQCSCVYSEIFYLSYARGYAKVSIKDLSRQVGLKDSQTKEYLEKLVNFGYLEKARSIRGANTYFLAWNDIVETVYTKLKVAFTANHPEALARNHPYYQGLCCYDQIYAAQKAEVKNHPEDHKPDKDSEEVQGFQSLDYAVQPQGKGENYKQSCAGVYSNPANDTPQEKNAESSQESQTDDQATPRQPINTAEKQNQADDSCQAAKAANFAPTKQGTNQEEMPSDPSATTGNNMGQSEGQAGGYQSQSAPQYVGSVQAQPVGGQATDANSLQWQGVMGQTMQKMCDTTERVSLALVNLVEKLSLGGAASNTCGVTLERSQTIGAGKTIQHEGFYYSGEPTLGFNGYFQAPNAQPASVPTDNLESHLTAPYKVDLADVDASLVFSPLDTCNISADPTQKAGEAISPKESVQVNPGIQAFFWQNSLEKQPTNGETRTNPNNFVLGVGRPTDRNFSFKIVGQGQFSQTISVFSSDAGKTQPTPKNPLTADLSSNSSLRSFEKKEEELPYSPCETDGTLADEEENAVLRGASPLGGEGVVFNETEDAGTSCESTARENSTLTCENSKGLENEEPFEDQVNANLDGFTSDAQQNEDTPQNVVPCDTQQGANPGNRLFSAKNLIQENVLNPEQKSNSSTESTSTLSGQDKDECVKNDIFTGDASVVTGNKNVVADQTLGFKGGSDLTLEGSTSGSSNLESSSDGLKTIDCSESLYFDPREKIEPSPVKLTAGLFGKQALGVEVKPNEAANLTGDEVAHPAAVEESLSAEAVVTETQTPSAQSIAAQKIIPEPNSIVKTKAAVEEPKPSQATATKTSTDTDCKTPRGKRVKQTNKLYISNEDNSDFAKACRANANIPIQEKYLVPQATSLGELEEQFEDFWHMYPKYRQETSNRERSFEIFQALHENGRLPRPEVFEDFIEVESKSYSWRPTGTVINSKGEEIDEQKYCPKIENFLRRQDWAPWLNCSEGRRLSREQDALFQEQKLRDEEYNAARCFVARIERREYWNEYSARLDAKTEQLSLLFNGFPKKQFVICFSSLRDVCSIEQIEDQVDKFLAEPYTDSPYRFLSTFKNLVLGCEEQEEEPHLEATKDIEVNWQHVTFDDACEMMRWHQIFGQPLEDHFANLLMGNLQESLPVCRSIYRFTILFDQHIKQLDEIKKALPVIEKFVLEHDAVQEEAKIIQIYRRMDQARELNHHLTPEVLINGLEKGLC